MSETILTKELMVRTQILELLKAIVKDDKDILTRRMISSLSSRIHKLPYYNEE